MKKQVAQLTIDGSLVRVWPSIKETGRNGFCQTNVSNCCKGALAFLIICTPSSCGCIRDFSAFLRSLFPFKKAPLSIADCSALGFNHVQPLMALRWQRYAQTRKLPSKFREFNTHIIKNNRSDLSQAAAAWELKHKLEMS